MRVLQFQNKKEREIESETIWERATKKALSCILFENESVIFLFSEINFIFRKVNQSSKDERSYTNQNRRKKCKEKQFSLPKDNQMLCVSPKEINLASISFYNLVKKRQPFQSWELKGYSEFKFAHSNVQRGRNRERHRERHNERYGLT